MRVAVQAKICTLDFCDEAHKAKGLCARHYLAKWSGRPLVPRSRRVWAGSMIDTLDEWSEYDPRKGCLIWSRGTCGRGYAMINEPGVGPIRGHSAAFRLYYGDVPEGLQIDHMCGVRRCVNPLHLSAVTPMQNGQHMSNFVGPHGFRGVWKARSGRYVAAASVGRVRHIAGTFDSPEEAGAAAANLRRRLGFYSPGE